MFHVSLRFFVNAFVVHKVKHVRTATGLAEMINVFSEIFFGTHCSDFVLARFAPVCLSPSFLFILHSSLVDFILSSSPIHSITADVIISIYVVTSLIQVFPDKCDVLMLFHCWTE